MAGQLIIQFMDKFYDVSYEDGSDYCSDAHASKVSRNT